MTNIFEQMEQLNYEHEKQAHREIEKIDIAASKVAEKYSQYEVLKSFVDYRASMERVFARARIYGSSTYFIKNELLKIEMQIYGQQSGIDENILQAIKDDFSDLYLTITQIYSIAERLLQKFADRGEYKKFIESIRDISLSFVEIHEKNFFVSEIEESIYRLKMESLSKEGNPSMGELEQVYQEFKKEIGLSTHLEPTT